MNAIQERRFRILHIGQDDLLGLLRRIRELDNRPAQGYYLTSEGFPELPADVVVDAVHYDHYQRGFAVMLASIEFEPVPAGEQIPGLERSSSPYRGLNFDPWGKCTTNGTGEATAITADARPTAIDIPEPPPEEPPREEWEQQPKSEARLALEYDLRQALRVADGSELDGLIREKPDAILEAAKHHVETNAHELASVVLTAGGWSGRE